MPGQGGGSNPPVRLDPWQNIVNVHWNTEEEEPINRAICFYLLVQMPGFSDPDDGHVDVGLRYWSAYGWLYVPDVPAPPLYHGGFVWTESTDGVGEWLGSMDEFNIVGLQPHGPPGPSPFEYEGYDWGGRRRAGPPLGGEPPPTPPYTSFAAWRNPAGSTLLPHPLQPANFFRAGGFGIDAHEGTMAYIANWFDYPTAITATYLTEDYEYAGAVATRFIMPGADNILIGGPGDVEDPGLNSTDFAMWILLTKVEVTT